MGTAEAPEVEKKEVSLKPGCLALPVTRPAVASLY